MPVVAGRFVYDPFRFPFFIEHTNFEKKCYIPFAYPLRLISSFDCSCF